MDIAGTEWTTSEMLKKGAELAKVHCAKFGKKANFESTSGFLGAASIAHFSCKYRPKLSAVGRPTAGALSRMTGTPARNPLSKLHRTNQTHRDRSGAA